MDECKPLPPAAAPAAEAHDMAALSGAAIEWWGWDWSGGQAAVRRAALYLPERSRNGGDGTTRAATPARCLGSGYYDVRAEKHERIQVELNNAFRGGSVLVAVRRGQAHGAPAAAVREVGLVEGPRYLAAGADLRRPLHRCARSERGRVLRADSAARQVTGTRTRRVYD